ncbi:MAG TPA: sigma-70 family RNA polymerase sigma factor [Candidatus Tumulicola sp.]
MTGPEQTRRTIETVCRIESAKLIAGLTRFVRDVGFAEELAQDAFVAALEQWPGSGVPDNPAAWLMTAAKRRAIDRMRRDARLDRKYSELEGGKPAVQGTRDDALDAVLEAIDADRDDRRIDDDLLRLIFIACHPILSAEARVALTLRLLGGLTTDEIARAYLVPETTVAQRIVRAKRTLTAARVPFEIPSADDRRVRVASVLEVIYLIFNEGYAATAGDEWMRPALCEEALRLGRTLAALVRDDSEVYGLVALMELQASRIRARTTANGDPVTLLDQDRASWDHLLIGRGLAALESAKRLDAPLGSYALQASIAACHARATEAPATDWVQIVALYDALAELVPSPIVDLNRAIAIGMAYGPQAALEIVEGLAGEPSMRSYHLVHSARGDLLFKLGRAAEARTAFERAAALTRNARERALLLGRAHVSPN